MAKPGMPTGTNDRAASNARAQGFARGLVSEFRRITWPSRQEWVSATVLTVVLVISMGCFTYLVDQLCSFLFGLIHR